MFSSVCIFRYNMWLFQGQGVEAQRRHLAVAGSGCVQLLSFLSYSPAAVHVQLHAF